MSQSLTPEELAKAAAQGVAIALNARKPKHGGATEEFLWRPPLVCGIPPAIFYVDIQPDSDGNYAPGSLTKQ
jgi:hypothetical protein